MEIKGEDFIKKVQLQQEKNEIEQRLNEIKNDESLFDEETRQRSPQQQSQLDREVEIQEEREYSDIMLGKEGSNEKSKKRYLVLGLILVILFLLTIIIIRLVSNDSTSNDSFTNDSQATSESSVESNNIEDQYQKIIDEKLKTIKEEKESQEQEKAELSKLEEKEVTQPEPEAKPDVFEVKKEEALKPEPVAKKAAPKPVKKATPKPVAKKTSTNVAKSVTTKPKGTFVQIGAFSKMPTAKYLTDITSKGFSYKIYKVSINNKIFHKVLIGPYSSRSQAKIASDNIKKQLNVSGAFILTY